MNLRDEISKLSWPVLLTATLGAMTFSFAVSCGWWWLARHLAWWQYGLTAIGTVFAWTIVKTVWSRRRR